jgi:hypothetical protein
VDSEASAASSPFRIEKQQATTNGTPRLADRIAVKTLPGNAPKNSHTPAPRGELTQFARGNNHPGVVVSARHPEHYLPYDMSALPQPDKRSGSRAVHIPAIAVKREITSSVQIELVDFPVQGRAADAEHLGR